ncbi:MAG: ABC transporter substrate-binding protein [Spirochaetales bacterium]|nr:ABC transporter substrate-binding protein [Spirochaetales bacterium]
MKKIIKMTLFLLLCAQALSAQTVVVTNGWTAAFASLAGAGDLQVLAPYEMKHPPEYEITLKEMKMVADADFLIFAGYEAMMGRIRESLGDNSSVQMIQITTVNSRKVIRESVMKIAEALGTVEKAEENLKDIDTFFDFWQKDLSWHDDLLSSSVVHFHQQGLAATLGFKPVLVFGPAAPTLGETRTVLDSKPLLIIDNFHNPVSSSFLEMKEKPAVVSWINFPGHNGTKTMLDVLEYNRDELNRVLQEKEL